MWKRNVVITFSLFILFCSNSFAESFSGKVTRINLYGGDWGNSWKGGMLYKLDKMPAGVTYFTVRQSDVAFDNFYSALLAAQHAKSKIVVTYDPKAIDAYGYVTTRAITSISD
ncbi:hypothetical protein J8L86_12575 [Shewanella sp. MMG014]|uniref:hypothetical protein n=1 Tax=Shewanella sp. MMG014 TaxID=2822691 RepID=UPI001B37F8B3|nr:hypothetical protein [Shewanella sp. MMG014]MBQ4890687.1 hypothetical protein [Shewanella sp. MMG014]